MTRPTRPSSTTGPPTASYDAWRDWTLRPQWNTGSPFEGFEEWPGRVDSEVQKRIFETMLTKAQVQREALELPPEERIDLVVEIWDSLTAKDIPVPEWQRDLIRERLTELEGADPEDRATPWNKVLERVFPRKA